jgi:hypothetical protein
MFTCQWHKMEGRHDKKTFTQKLRMSKINLFKSMSYMKREFMVIA